MVPTGCWYIFLNLKSQYIWIRLKWASYKKYAAHFLFHAELIYLHLIIHYKLRPADRKV